MGAKWYEKSFRRNLVDMHIDDWDESFLSKLDPARYVELLERANVQSAMVYANSHVGLCYSPTASGRMHRGIPGRDMFGEIAERCRRAGIDVVGYYSLIFNNWAYEAHPSWRTIDADGVAAREQRGRAARYGTCCPNSPGYRAFVDEQIRELCDGYALNGMFFDMTFWPTVCYCASCSERYAREIGSEMPRVVDWGDDAWCAFQARRETWLVEFAAFATDSARRRKQALSIEHNSALLTAGWRMATNAELVGHND